MDDVGAHGSAPLATGPLGMKLLSFHRAAEDTRFEDAVVGYALMVLWHENRVLMVLERDRACWELPGGGIEPGETPRAAAVREVREEAGQRVPPRDVHFAGFARTLLPDHAVMYGAMFTARTDAPAPFVPNEEISAVHWRVGDEPLPGGEVQTVDEYLVALCPPPPAGA
ncbi:MAG: NUDIX hydrolase [Streptomyces sp.]|uniref:NUDIX hydrolase n=1 Tax=Streptomyces sp. TaxID=1931 RepID=UPI003D6A358F